MLSSSSRTTWAVSYATAFTDYDSCGVNLAVRFNRRAFLASRIDYCNAVMRGVTASSGVDLS